MAIDSGIKTSSQDKMRPFVALKFLHAVADGMLIPVQILMLSARGLPIAGIGLVMAAFSLSIALFELPTGGFADAWGRKQVLILAGTINVVGILLFGLSSLVPLLILGVVLRGIARSLASGPLEAWFVDAAQRVDPEADLSRGLSCGASGENVGIAVGALVGGAIPLMFRHLGASGDALLLSLSPTFIAAALVTVIELTAIIFLVENETISDGSLLVAVRQVPNNVASGLEVANSDLGFRSVLVRLFFLGIAVAAFDIFVPLRLTELGLSKVEASTVFGILAMASALGAAGTALLAPRLKRLGTSPLAVAGVVTVMSGVFGLLSVAPVVALVLAGYFMIRTLNGPVMPLLGGEIHMRIDSKLRATLISVLSLAAMLGAVAGSLILTQIANLWSNNLVALVAGAVALVLGGLALIRARFVWS